MLIAKCWNCEMLNANAKMPKCAILVINCMYDPMHDMEIIMAYVICSKHLESYSEV